MILLAKVEAVFSISGRGVVVIPSFLSEHRLRSGEPIQLRGSSGKAISTAIFSVESANMGSGMRRPAFLLTRDVAREDIVEGDEIWIQERRKEDEK